MKFPLGAEFFDVEGIPVTRGAGVPGLYCAAWDTDPPRSFPSDSVTRNGGPISEEKFREWVEQIRTANPRP
jgi:hypothetical protein